jgi:hypothetical protein
MNYLQTLRQTIYTCRPTEAQRHLQHVWHDQPTIASNNM